MAGKEATVYVIDVGASMGLKRHGREENDLEWGLKYVWDKIATEVSTGRKGLNTGIIAFRSNETEHDMPAEEAYEHISVLQPIKQLLMPDLRILQHTLVPSSTDDGDALSALATALQMIILHCKALKFKKKIVVITNGSGFLDVEGLEAFVEQINKDSIELVILGADFDDPEYGYKEEDKDEHKAANEEVLRKLAEGCNGLIGSLQQAVAELDMPRLKGTRSMRTYQGFLTLGDSSKFESAMAIDVERYARTMIQMPPSASTFVLKSDPGGDETQEPMMNGHADGHAGDGLAGVQTLRAYQVKDDQAPGGKRDVEREALAKGFEYGQTVVPVSETDMNVFVMETEAAYDILGFIPTESYPHFMNMDKTHFIIPQRSNNKAILALSSLIHALYELDSHAVARLVVKRNKEPVLVLLSYEINNEFECLYENSLPFFEDLRAYKFPPLNRILTVSGKTLTVHRNLPEKELQDDMDNLVDKMDLSTYDRDDEGNPTEYLPMDETFSPIYHRLNQVIKYRAIHPEGLVPPPSDIIIGPMRPPYDLLETMKPYLEGLKNSANVKKVPPKTASRKTKRNADPPRSNLDLDGLLGERAVQSEGGRRKISPSNAIPEFKQYLLGNDVMEDIRDAFSQFGPIIETWIKHSFGDSGYERAVEGISVMRQEAIEIEEPSLYNSFMKALKKKLLNEQLSGDRRDMWYKLRRYKLGLVDKGSSGASEIEADEAREFLTALK